mgnify:CR=1 FL=1
MRFLSIKGVLGSLGQRYGVQKLLAAPVASARPRRRNNLLASSAIATPGMGEETESFGRFIGHNIVTWIMGTLNYVIEN